MTIRFFAYRTRIHPVTPVEMRRIKTRDVPTRVSADQPINRPPRSRLVVDQSVHLQQQNYKICQKQRKKNGQVFKKRETINRPFLPTSRPLVGTSLIKTYSTGSQITLIYTKQKNGCSTKVYLYSRRSSEKLRSFKGKVNTEYDADRV